MWREDSLKQSCKFTVGVSLGGTRAEFPEPSPDCGAINLGTALTSESFKKFYRLNQGASLRESRQQGGGDWSLLLGLATRLLLQNENTERAPLKILKDSR